MGLGLNNVQISVIFAYIKKFVDKSRKLCYDTLVVERRRTYGRVVELVDSLDSGSSVHCGRAGSSPASPTK